MMKITIPIEIKVEITDYKSTFGDIFYMVDCPKFAPHDHFNYSSMSLPDAVTEVASYLARKLTPERITYEITKQLKDGDVI